MASLFGKAGSRAVGRGTLKRVAVKPGNDLPGANHTTGFLCTGDSVPPTAFRREDEIDPTPG
jgi:hypothetical protein